MRTVLKVVTISLLLFGSLQAASPQIVSEELKASGNETVAGNSAVFTSVTQGTTRASSVGYEIIVTGGAAPDFDFFHAVTFDGTNFVRVDEPAFNVTSAAVNRFYIHFNRLDHGVGQNSRLEWDVTLGNLTFSVNGHMRE